MSTEVKTKPRNWPYYVLAVVVASVCGVLIWLGVSYDRKTDAEGAARDAALSVKIDQIAAKTKDNIVVKKNAYRWGEITHTIHVTMKLGSCDNVEGYFVGVPTRPEGASQIGTLKIIVRGVTREVEIPDAEIDFDDPTLYSKLMSSALAHCVAGEGNFSR